MSTILPLILLLIPTISAGIGSPYRIWPRQETSSNSSSSANSSSPSSGNTPLRIRNNCAQTIWPGIGTQNGKGPETNGFELSSGSMRELTVSSNWQGRVWGRTDCHFNEDGTRSSNGQASACGTGDCFGVLNCVGTGATPVTLFEIALEAGSDNAQSFYDISLVDGYNLDIGLTYIGGGSSLDLPPNLTNCACVASTIAAAGGATGGNASFPAASADVKASELSSWCPWDLQLDPPTKPGDGVYPYPDDNIKRPDFNPCLSECAKTNSEQACCAGKFNDPKVCKPGDYSTQAKVVCPDAYSFAFDDQTSTFIVPTGGGWEISFCPGVASTNIIKTFPKQLADLGQGRFGPEMMEQMMTWDTVKVTSEAAGRGMVGDGERVGSLGALVVMLAFVCLM